MADGRSWVPALLACNVLLGCTADSSMHEEEVAVTSAALSVCEEAVPTDRNIDGFPAYAQCAASENSAIYSNNGIDTSTTQVTPEWVRTQYSGGYQCTELAHRYLYFKWGIDWVPRGNAGQWCDTPPPQTIGLVQTMAPVHGDVMVLAPGSCGASASTGHATVVDQVDASGRLVVVEQNRARRGTYMLSCAKCFLHVVENDGTPGTVTAGSGAVAGAGGAAAGAGGAPGAWPQAGASAPVPPPMQTPPAMMPPPAMQPPPAAPVTPVPAAPGALAGTGASPIGSGGAAAPLPSGVAPRPLAASAASDAGCSVAHAGETGRGAPSCVGVLLGAVLLAARTRRRRWT